MPVNQFRMDRRICEICGTEFEVRVKMKNKVCSTKCSMIRGKTLDYSKPKEIKKCLTCSGEFLAHPKRKYCSAECIPTKSLKIKYRKTRRHEGSYVYGWYKKDSILPFYIGQGTKRRAWRVHKVEHQRTAACEIVRCCLGRIEVVVYRDRLTVEGALLVESVLIDEFNRMGALLTNQVGGLSRQEVPPLTY